MLGLSSQASNRDVFHAKSRPALYKRDAVTDKSCLQETARFLPEHLEREIETPERRSDEHAMDVGL
jgi:hypothetical protein